MNSKEWREKQQAYAEKAQHILSQMSLGEKIKLMSGNSGWLQIICEALIIKHYNIAPISAGGNERLQIPAVKFCDGPRGVVCGNATCFPVSMARGASFDPELEERVGEVIGKEVRAFGGNFYGGVCINLLRHPAGGRAQETYGEDPFHIGQMGSALVRGVQKHNVIACVKHFALNNQETARFKIDITCDERTLREVYLPHFKDCLNAGAGSVMGAYNKFRGEYLCQNEYMLKTILKNEWGFEGFVVSDFVYGVKDTVSAANAGLDIEMPNTRFYGKNLVRAIERGEINPSVVDEAALRIVRTLLVYAEAPDALETYPTSLILSQEHIALAREVAEKSIVLLKNDGNILPLSKERVKKVTMIGKLADYANIGDHGSSRVFPPYVVSPLEGVRRLLGESVEVSFSDGSDLERAKQLAGEADAVVLVMGYTHEDEGEYIDYAFYKIGGDRKSLNLHSKDIALLQALLPLCKQSVVVLVGGSAILMEEWQVGAPAILHAFYPGMEGGTAIARVLFGMVNPGGKLPFSIPKEACHLPDFDRDANQCHYDYYHGYTKLEKERHEPAFAFGYGLSYTSFRIEKPVFEVQNKLVTATLELTNMGMVTGDEVVQFYVGFENSRVERPKKLLRGFQRVTLEPGVTKTIEITCPVDRLRWYNPERKEWELEHMEYQAYIGTSSREEDLLTGVFAV
jgi:beta-glucosidase